MFVFCNLIRLLSIIVSSVQYAVSVNNRMQPFGPRGVTIQGSPAQLLSLHGPSTGHGIMAPPLDGRMNSGACSCAGIHEVCLQDVVSPGQCLTERHCGGLSNSICAPATCVCLPRYLRSSSDECVLLEECFANFQDTIPEPIQVMPGTVLVPDNSQIIPQNIVFPSPGIRPPPPGFPNLPGPPAQVLPGGTAEIIQQTQFPSWVSVEKWKGSRRGMNECRSSSQSDSTSEDTSESEDSGKTTESKHSTNTKTKAKPYIVNGETAAAHDWPWQAALVDSMGRVSCGAVLITADVLLTAAHCVNTGVKPSVRLGSHFNHHEENGEQTVSIEHITIHPRYDAMTQQNDIALIHLRKRVRFTDSIAPACLPDKVATRGTNCHVTGWGTTHSDIPLLPNALQQSRVTVISDAQCRSNPGYWNLVDSTMMCAEGRGDGDACYGDSGGPLSCRIDGEWQVQGLVSWGIECGRFPGVYTQVAAYRDWIESYLE